MRKNPFEDLVDRYNSRKDEQVNALRKDLAYLIYELRETLPAGEKIEAHSSYTCQAILVIEPGKTYLENYCTIQSDSDRCDGRVYHDMKDEPVSKQLSIMGEHALLSVAERISSYLKRKEYEAEEGKKDQCK